MQNIVIVKSKTINNESVPVVFHTVEKTFGGVKDIREISRSYIFHNFQARIPLKLAKILVKQNPNEFSLVKPAEETASEELKQEVKKEIEKKKPFVCKYCGKDDIKSLAGLKAHIRFQHPDKWIPKEK